MIVAVATALTATASAAAPAAVAVVLPSGGKLVAAVGSSSSFRLGVSFETDTTKPGGASALPSVSLETTPPAPSTPVSWGGMDGIKTSFGALLVSPAGDWSLYDEANVTILQGSAPVFSGSDSIGTIQLPVKNGTGMHGGAEPCLSNGIFAPNYYWDSEAGFLAFAVSPWDSDPAQPQKKYVHCYPAGFTDKSGGYTDPERDWVSVALGGGQRKAPPGSTCSKPQTNTDLDLGGAQRSGSFPRGIKVTGGPASCCKACDDAESKNPKSAKGCTAWVATSDGKPDSSGMNCWPFAKVYRTHKRSDRTFGGSLQPGPPAPPPAPPPPAGRSGWWVAGRSADWYLSPAKGGYDFTANLYDIIGAPGVPPRYAMAFMATYWGYESMGVVDTNMTAMRGGNYPIDSFIMDYDWFGPGPCAPGCTHGGQSSCPLSDQGGLYCGDYGYEGSKWAKNTFSVNGQPVTTSSPKEVLSHFHKNRNMKWAGIRKPRSYSNVNLSAANGWMLAADTNVGAGGNNWNYTVESLRTWYTEKHLHFLDDGVDFWWNDEGETQWYTYYYWNLAQQAQWAKARPNQRFFTINRAFTPGMQRFPATTWTGDRQDCSHEVMLRFSMYGQPYHECDMTSTSPTDLVRQYQNAVFSPIMRVHQMHGVPRFPYLWCDGARGGHGDSGPEHCVAFRQALDLRYHLIPYVYSLAHIAHREGKPIARPALFEYPDWTPPTPCGRHLDAPGCTWGTWHTYMLGSHIVAADLGFKDGAAKTENSATVVLPPGQWFRLNSTTTVKGDAIHTESDLAITDFPVYIREGAILTLNKEKVQWSEAQGGTLEVQVYSGADGTFTVYEDDGTTLDYKKSADAVRMTNFTWHDSNKTLSWSSSRGPVRATEPGAIKYSTLEVVLFEAGAGTSKRSASKAIGNSGSVNMA